MEPTPEDALPALRRFARGLVYDPAQADDLVQEAWLAAIHKTPPAGTLASWLRVAVRNLAHAFGRAEARRAARERTVARPEALPSAAETAAQLELLHRLIAALEELDEPGRTLVRLRYLEGLAPREIARRSGLAPSAVRSQLHRALARLRARLKRDGGRDELLAALVPLAGAPPRFGIDLPWSPVVGAPLVIKLVAALALLASLTWFSWPATHRSATPTAEPRAPVVAATSGDGSARSSASPASSSAREERLSIEHAWIVRGQAFSGQGIEFPHLALVGRVFAGPDGPDGDATPTVEARFTSDEHGEFAWPLAEPSELVSLTVTPEIANHEIFPAEGFFVPGDPAPELRVYAQPLDVRVHGVVRDERGQPLAGARVASGGEANHPDGCRSRGVSTNEAGEYALDVASTAGLPLYVEADGCVPAQERLGELRAGEDVEHDVTLRDGLRVAGHVLDDEGRPLAGAWVGSPSVVTTDANGAFELGELERRENSYLWAGASGHARKLVMVSERQEELTIRLARGTRLSGRVVGPDGAPVPWTWVSLEFAMRAAPSWRNEAWTDAEGRFELPEPLTRDAGDGIWMGEKQLWLWRAGFAQRRVEVHLPEDGPASFQVELALEANHFLAGVLLDGDGRPLARRTVYARDPAEVRPGFEGLWGRTDAEGRFRIDGLPSDRAVLLTASAMGHLPLEQRVTALDRDDLVLHLARAARRVGFAGTVVDAETGAPLSRFTVRVLPNDSLFAPERRLRERLPYRWGEGVRVDDASGAFALLDDLDVGLCAGLLVEAPGYARSFASVVTAREPDAHAWTVRLARPCLVRGRVLDHASGAPLADVRVRRFTDAERLDFDHWRMLPVLEARTDAEGHFELSVPPGTTSLAAGATGLLDVMDGPFEVAASGTSERWIEFGGDARVTGRLLDDDARPLAGQTIGVYGERALGGPLDAFATTDETGRFAFEGLPEGEFFVGWKRLERGEHFYAHVRAVTLRRDTPAALELRPSGAANLRGTLVVGATRGAVLVTVTPEEDPPRDPFLPRDGQRSCIAVDGRFELPHLAAGRYVVAVQPLLADGSEGYAAERVEVPASGEIVVTLTVGSPP